MTNEELKNYLKDDKAIQKIAMVFIRYRTMEAVANKLETSVDDLEDFFIDNPDVEEKFNTWVEEQSSKLAKRKIRAGLDTAIGKLNELISDPDEDEKYAYQSASTLLNIWTKIDKTNTTGATKEEEDDLDKIFKDLTNDARTKEDT